MGMPSINIAFTELAASLIKRGERGIIAIIIKDTLHEVETNNFVIRPGEEPRRTLKEENKEQIKLALKGYQNTPLKAVVYILPETSEEGTVDYTNAFNFLQKEKWDYLVVPTVETDGKTEDVVAFIKEQRKEKKAVKAILPNIKADSEAIINFATEKVMVNDKEYTTEQYCSRIAGIIAGTPISISCTFAPLNELTDCSRLNKEEMDEAVDQGKFILWWDGEKVKTARGVNSLVTLTSEKNTQFQKIKIVDAMDMIENDIRMTVEDNYIGKYPNTYDNKCLLMSAIGNYFDTLVRDDVIAGYTLDIDIAANKTYLKGKGKDVDKMSEREIREANTGSSVFLTATLKMLDAIEDVELNISI